MLEKANYDSKVLENKPPDRAPHKDVRPKPINKCMDQVQPPELEMMCTKPLVNMIMIFVIILADAFVYVYKVPLLEPIDGPPVLDRMCKTTVVSVVWGMSHALDASKFQGTHLLANIASIGCTYLSNCEIQFFISISVQTLFNSKLGSKL
jgi:hypothetical protein